MEVLKIIVWPITVILIVLLIIFLFKKSINDLIKRISGFKYGKLGADIVQHRQEKTDKALFEQDQEARPNQAIEKALGLFSPSTLEKIKKLVENESKINEISEPHLKIEVLSKYSQALYIIFSFERLYNIIFGSQLYILDFVNTNNSQTRESLKVFYDNATEKNPGFFDSYSYDEYLDFLISYELILFNKDGTCNITWFGRDFLKFLIETGKTLNKRF